MNRKRASLVFFKANRFFAYVTLILGVSFGLGLIGCDRFLHDEPTSPSAFRATADGCLRTASTSFKGYSEGLSSPSAVGTAWDCGSRSIDRYLARVRGAEPTFYTASEMRSFFERYVGDATKVDDALLRQVMKLKQVLLGGSADRVTRDELRRAQAAIRVLKAESLNLLPHMKILTMSADAADGVAPAAIAAAGRQAVASAAAIAPLFAFAEGTYAFADAKTFLEGISALREGAVPSKGLDWVSQHLSFLAALKSFLVKPGGDAVQPGEWPPLIAGLGRLLSLSAQTHYVPRGAKSLSGDGLETLSGAVNELFSGLEMAVRNKPDGAVPWALMDGLLHEFYGPEAVAKPPLSEVTLQKVLRPLIERIFNWRESAAGQRRNPERGLTLAAVDEMRAVFRGWAEMQRLWERLHGKVEAAAALRSDGRIGYADVRRQWALFPPGAFSDQEELARVFGSEQDHPLATDGADIVMFQRDARDLSLDSFAFTELNWKRLVIRGAIRGFAADPVAARWSGLELTEFKAFFDALRPVAVELGMIAPNDVSTWKSTFYEADAMLFASDGNGVLSYQEGVDLITFAISASKMSRKVYRSLAAEGPARDADCARDESGLPKIDRGIVEANLRTRFSSGFAPIAGWRNFVGSLDQTRWSELKGDLVVAMRRPLDGPTTLDSLNIDHLTMILQFIEATFIRFDKDGDGFLNLDEAKAAFPYFRTLLGNAADGMPASSLEPLFIYLLEYGKAPTDDFTGFLFWSLQPGRWEVHADRATLIKIVGSFQGKK